MICRFFERNIPTTLSRLPCILMLLAMPLQLFGQLPADFRSEQVHLGVSTHEIEQGDTLDLEGQVTCLAKDRLLPYSNYLYVELFDGEDSVLVRQKVSCKEQGRFHTRIPTGTGWAGGVYYLRAYTQLMRNFSPHSFPIQPVLIGKRLPVPDGEVRELFCKVVPTGGKLVAGQPQSIVAQLTDSHRFPVSTRWPSARRKAIPSVWRRPAHPGWSSSASSRWKESVTPSTPSHRSATTRSASPPAKAE